MFARIHLVVEAVGNEIRCKRCTRQTRSYAVHPYLGSELRRQLQRESLESACEKSPTQGLPLPQHHRHATNTRGAVLP